MVSEETDDAETYKETLHYVSLATPTPLQIESIQVLAALVKFYFHIIQLVYGTTILCMDACCIKQLQLSAAG